MFEIYTIEESDSWDGLVRSFENYDVYWLSGYVKAFYIHGDGEPLLFYYSDENTRGISVVMKRDVASDACFEGRIPSNTYFDFTTCYGYGGWLIEGKETEKLFKAYETWCAENDIICEFIRFHPIIKNHKGCEKFYQVIPLGKVVHIDLSSPELIWNNFTSKNRNMIRKALKNDVKIYNGRFPEIYEKFRIIYNETMHKDRADEYYYFKDDFYKSVLEDLAENAQVFYAVKDDAIIAASIMLETNSRMNYHLSGNLQKYNSFAPTNLLLYKAALWGYANGYKTLYLGGGLGAEEDSLFKFKRAFNKGDINQFFIGEKIYNQQKYEELLNFRLVKCNKIARNSSFPEYRG